MLALWPYDLVWILLCGVNYSPAVGHLEPGLGLADRLDLREVELAGHSLRYVRCAMASCSKVVRLTN